MFEKIVIVKRKTRMEELIERFNSRSQTKFYIEHSGGDFSEYVEEDSAYNISMELLRRSLDLGLKLQIVDREFIPNFLFTEKDIVVTVGQDGLVANTAKYVGEQPIIAVNPDSARFDGILLPFYPAQARRAVQMVLEQKARIRSVTMAEVNLNDGQRLLAFNDLFIGARTHVSARYNIRLENLSEPQSSSGVLVSTGAGSTGWLSSIFNMAAGVASFMGGSCGSYTRLNWEDPRLLFVVREPFVSRHSKANIVAGMLQPEKELILESLMPSGGVIFSDGIEADYIQFNSGSIARVGPAKRSARLVVN
jgi:NAD kinase